MKAIVAILGSVLVLALPVAAAPPSGSSDAAPVPVRSLRGDTPIDQTPESEIAKLDRDLPVLLRSSNVEPPLIPHTIRGYQVTKNVNKCMDCHAAEKVRESGATKVSDTHYGTRDGRVLPNISPRRYVCTTCHIPQTDAPPLVVNTFRPAPELAPKK